MTSRSLIVNCEEETNRLAKKLAKTLHWPQTIFLKGDLGAGKTSFARALIRALSSDEALNVPSPTFTLLQTYETKAGSIHHYDLYRLEEPEEVFELGWEESVADALCLIEWPDRAGDFLPETALTILIEKIKGEDTKRQITLTGLFPEGLEL